MQQRQQIALGEKGKEYDVHRFGEPGGPAIVYSHGLPSSGLEARILLEEAEKTGKDIIAITRPGYARSTSNVTRTLPELTEDYLRILDQLGITDFYAVGTSAGAKDALSLAHKEPDRVNGVSIVAPFPSLHIPEMAAGIPFGLKAGLTALSYFPGVLHKLGLWLIKRNEVLPAFRSPEAALAKFTAMQPETDQEVLQRPEVRKKFLAVIRDWTTSPTQDGMFGDLLRVSRPWGFDPRDVRQTVQIIHGGLDPVAPYDAAVGLSSMFRNWELHSHYVSGHAIYAYPHAGEAVLRKIDQTNGQ